MTKTPPEPDDDAPAGAPQGDQTYASLYRLFADNVQDLISLHDVGGAFVYASPSARELLGYEPHELQGLLVYDLVVESDRAVLQAAHEAILRREGRHPALYRVARRDGTVIWCETTARVVPHETTGEPWRIVAVTRDVTERRTVEQQLLQAQKMEALGRLAGGIAHDFNNVLTVIAGHAELLTARVPEGSAERANAEFIRDAAFRAAALTRQLLAFGRGEGRDLQYSDLNATVLDLQPMLARVIGSEVALDIELEPRLRSVRCEPAALEQILVNLIVNARDAMPEGGRVSIRTENVSLAVGEHASLTAGPYVQLTVSDNGTGMTRETAARAFEPFFTTKEPGRGSGLGLSTVYSIMRQVRGSVSADSGPGAGATFTLLFPGYDEPVTQTPDGRLLSGSRLEGTETILVAEDDPGVRALVVASLQRYGYNVLAAVDGMQALEIFTARDDIDAIVTDVNMPRLRGPEMVNRVRDTGAPQPVLFISGFTSEALSLGDSLTQRFLAKPFTPIELVQTVRSLLDMPD